jgi:hypothetical protein
MSDENIAAINASPCADCDNPRWESSYKLAANGVMRAQRVQDKKRCNGCEKFQITAP